VEGLNILIVEDEEIPAELLRQEINQRLPESIIEVRGSFSEALDLIRGGPHIDVVVLDLYEGSLQRENLRGQTIWDIVWNQRFLPIIVFTAGEVELEPQLPEGNPFVTVVRKGGEAVPKVVDRIAAIRPHVLAVRDVHGAVDRAIQSVLRSSAPLIWRLGIQDDAQRAGMLVRSVRRRLAATMDLGTLLEEGMKAWEMYVIPPVEGNLLTGDLLQRREAPIGEAASFLLVLSPSCDLIIRPNGKPNLDRVLVAKCEPVSGLIDSVRSLARIKTAELPERLPHFLTQPHIGGRVPLPSLEGVIPAMAANLRSLDLINMEDISREGSPDKPFSRVASIDSPFREQVVWAFLSVAGRPGVPDRDFQEWAAELAREGTSQA